MGLAYQMVNPRILTCSLQKPLAGLNPGKDFSHLTVAP